MRSRVVSTSRCACRVPRVASRRRQKERYCWERSTPPGRSVPAGFSAGVDKVSIAIVAPWALSGPIVVDGPLRSHAGLAFRGDRHYCRRVRARRCRAAWIAGAALLLCGGAARAEVRGLSFPVRGMVCPLCTRGVEESLKRLPGVASVRADLASGRVDVEAEDGQSLNLEVVRQRTARAGFPVNGESDVVARGRFTIGADGRITFRVTGSTYAWQVLEGQQLRVMFLG